jgi:ABC-type polar amino acid transport system ATPase subunit
VCSITNVRLALHLCGTEPRRARRAKARALLHDLGLGARLHHLPQALSTVEQQRVAVARALINAPDVLLADEPTAHVDPETREVVQGPHTALAPLAQAVAHGLVRASRLFDLLVGAKSSPTQLIMNAIVRHCQVIAKNCTSVQ